MLALPAETGKLRERFFHHRRGIDEHFHIAAESLHHPAGQCFQPFLDHVVIIGALRIDADSAAFAPFQNVERIAMRRVIQAQHNDRARCIPKLCRIGAPCGRGFHPHHVAMMALREVGGEPIRCLWLRRRARKSDCVEAAGNRAFTNGFVRVRWRRHFQKSSSEYCSAGGWPGTRSFSNIRNDGRDFMRTYHSPIAGSSDQGTSP